MIKERTNQIQRVFESHICNNHQDYGGEKKKKPKKGAKSFQFVK